ncbi:MAG: respiratory nitrate reductase subunit gamma, partial [Gammaproteobacteria bacterium]|nr:respiratory nitrate reductase subunit gamma [Gammaproteobacteria bacterium]
MANTIHQLLFGYYPHLALAVFFIGSIARFEYAQYGWTSSSSQLLRNKHMQLGSNLFHIGIILLFFGHLFGLLTPEKMYHHFILSSTKQLLSMIAGGIFGILCFIGMTLLVYRRLFDKRIRANSNFSDILILLILYTQLILGLWTIPISANHLNGANMVVLATWVQHILTFQPNAADLITHQHFIFKLHLFLGLTIFLIFPFTRLVHVWSLPLGYFFRTGYQIVRKGLGVR